MDAQRPIPWVEIHLRATGLGQVDKNKQVPIRCAPYAFTVERNDYREADTASVTFDFEDFPFDPRLIRGAIFMIYIADLSALSGVTGHEFWTSLTPDERGLFAIFAGVVDDVINEIDDEGRRTKLKGRDYTAYLLDASLPKEKEIDWGTKTFVQHIRELLDFRVTTKPIEIVKRGTVPDFKPADYKSVKKESAESSKRKRLEGETYWEAIQEIALEAGFIVFMELDKLVIQEPKTMNPDRIDESRLWRWTLGGNVKSYRPSRRLGRQHGLNVQVTSFNGETGKRMRAIAPQKGEEELTEVAPIIRIGGSAKPSTAQTQFVVTPFVVRNISDQDQLQRIADSIYAQLRHFEMEADLETDSLFDSNGRPVWGIQYSDPVRVDLSKSWVGTILVKSLSEQIDALVALGYKLEDAKELLERLDHLDLPFILDSARFSYSTESDEGFRFGVTLRSRKMVTLDAVEDTSSVSVTAGS